MSHNLANGETPHDAPAPQGPGDATRPNDCPCPAACAHCPDDCRWCNPPEPRHECPGCNWIGRREDFIGHRCKDHPDSNYDSYDIPTPRVAQLTIELFDLIELNPLDPNHVRRISDGTQVPINNFGVMDILSQPIDLPTANAITAELAHRANNVARYVARASGDELLIAQHTLRTYIRAQLAVAE